MNEPQIKMLQQIYNVVCFDYSDVSKDEKNILRFLNQKRFIRHIFNPTNNRPCYVITELGKEALYSNSKDNIRFWIPVIISNVMSLIAIIISIIALLK